MENKETKVIAGAGTDAQSSDSKVFIDPSSKKGFRTRPLLKDSANPVAPANLPSDIAKKGKAKTEKAAKPVKEKKAKEPKPVKEKKVKVAKVEPEYLTLNISYDKAERLYSATDAKTGKEFKGTKEIEAPRQVMMMLAFEHKPQQVLYMRGTKWRRKVLKAVEAKTVAPAKKSEPKATVKAAPAASTSTDNAVASENLSA